MSIQIGNDDSHLLKKKPLGIFQYPSDFRWYQLLGWPKSSFGFFFPYDVLENQNGFLGQSNIFCLSIVTVMVLAGISGILHLVFQENMVPKLCYSCQSSAVCSRSGIRRAVCASDLSPNSLPQLICVVVVNFPWYI